MLQLYLPIQYSMSMFYIYQHTKSKINKKTKVENSQHDTKNNSVGGSSSPDKDIAPNQSRNWGNISTFVKENRK